ncbi:DUF2867 domain-containing protein [Streptomyces sp. A7024]|uniref:DUF2867 domain-containing protein n=1 Tax=Streptomyces coryli TaxID=1128680 RepID=A0A6G4U3E8_9ACTN|nr:DUF2867 domain-containing protein [Streptomyces coryli]NGN65888.1 DUF2867 domain-containing protein [Streptomyces coryli]
MSLPYVDEHAAVIEAGAEDVWRELGVVVERSFSGRAGGRFAGLIGAEDRAPAGPRPLAAGSAVVGFRVAAAEPGRELVLRGRHRFSAYALTFRLDRLGPDRTRLRAETRAAFPGVGGRIYGALVVGTRGHLVVVRRLLGSVRRRAERGGAVIS